MLKISLDSLLGIYKGAGMMLWAVGQHLWSVVSFAYTTARKCALSGGCLIKYSSTARKCILTLHDTWGAFSGHNPCNRIALWQSVIGLEA